ncbi:hypothetical protein SPHINGO391_220020 [Sphingomonas aurantiaca]|uniref:Uncharacterized protein n=1 Tax=Sphingomonas aurantiaca TaxID=185949 RepID=A0A5E7XUS9_9SPHN|nr:hypothetical protein SPHINGO391_220020 [Sphingomonas aurantiaca]
MGACAITGTGKLIAQLVQRFAHIDHGRTDTRQLFLDPISLIKAVTYESRDTDPPLFGLGGIYKRLPLPQPNLDGI